MVKDSDRSPRTDIRKKVVYNNSSKQLTEEQLELLVIGLDFGIAPKKFPLVEYITATEVLCQKLEDMGDSESVEKARAIRNEVFLHLKRGYKMKLKSNLSPDQRRVLNELKADDTIIICPADKERQWSWKTEMHISRKHRISSMRGIMRSQKRARKPYWEGYTGRLLSN